MWAMLAGVAIVLYLLLQIKEWLFAPANLPPMYSEFPTLPFLGSIYQYATGPREFLQRGQKKMGDIFTIKLFGARMTYLMGTEGHQEFFAAKEHVYDIREAYKCTIVTFGPGVCYDCPIKKMGEQLGFFKTGLTADKYFSYVGIIQQEVEQYFDENWGDGGEKCLFNALSEVFTLTSARCLLGPEVRALWSGEYSQMYLDLDHSFIPITFFFPNLPNPMRSKCVKARSTFEKIFTEIVDKRRQNEEQYDDFLQVLMDIKYKNGKPLNSAEITGIMMGTLLGGQHTSNVTGTWALCHLLTDDSWRSQVMEEQSKLLDGDLSRDLEYPDVEKMEVFDMVLNETLRLHPPFFMLARVAMETTQFNGYTIPKGDFVAVSPGACQRMPEMWGDAAETFDPSRWTAEEKLKHKKYSWIPFGGGRHQCSGRKFALLSLKAALAWVLRNYDLKFPAGKMPEDDYTTMVVAPSAPVTVQYKRKTHKK